MRPPWPQAARLTAWLTPRRQALAGLCLAVVLLWPAARHALEASMWRHMVLQFPLLMASGALLAVALPERLRRWVMSCNTHGIAGLVWISAALAVLMIPRVLDLALYRSDIEVAKCAALLLAGVALRLSWRPAGLIIQGFFLGNLLMMMVVVGQLYIDSPLRLCNAYLLDDQQRLGQWLISLAAFVGLTWLANATWRLIQRDEARLAQQS
ncbi:hypothetical protein GCM10022279_15060 [Comamonas faecalis]|uniref:Cytochrome c oxidase assembly protein n=2 Tax=Comamonas faecalis TaxID=1387849 RepID=A0ABP7R5L6_9BURK